MSLLFDNLKASKNLPLGHVDRKKAQAAVDKIYQQCREVEKKWIKPFKKFKAPRTGQEAIKFCNNLCRMLGQKTLKAIVLQSNELHSEAGAHYDRRQVAIHFPHKWISFHTLMHELAHHFGPSGHGQDFCDTLDLLYEIVYTEIWGKKLKLKS